MATQSVTLRWAGAERFEGGRADGPQITLDSAGVAGPTPPQALLLALGGCMAIDIVDIAAKMRLPLTALDVRVDGERREVPPRRYTAIRLVFTTAGVAAADRDKVQRAIDLSREKYCSVWHTLQSDIEYTIDLELR